MNLDEKSQIHKCDRSKRANGISRKTTVLSPNIRQLDLIALFLFRSGPVREQIDLKYMGVTSRQHKRMPGSKAIKSLKSAFKPTHLPRRACRRPHPNWSLIWPWLEHVGAGAPDDVAQAFLPRHHLPSDAGFAAAWPSPSAISDSSPSAWPFPPRP